MNADPVRVLHVIDGLAAGGSERWVWDIVRLTDSRQLVHRVVTVHPDLGRFVYASQLRDVGAYSSRPPAGTPGDTPRVRQRWTSRAARTWTRHAGTVPAVIGRPLRAAWHFAGVFPAALWRAWSEVRSFNPDVIHAHTFHGFALGVLLARWSRRPLIYTVPALFCQMSDAGYGWAPRWYARWHESVSMFVTPYPQELTDLGIDAAKIIVTEPVGDVEAAQCVTGRRSHWRHTIRRSLGIPDDAHVLLSVGRLHPSKGHEVVVPALTQVLAAGGNVYWVVLGDGDGRAVLQAAAADRGLSDRVFLCGFVPNSLPYYAAADLYLRTMLFEGDNSSSFYAMAMGLPVVAFDTGRVTELITRAHHGLLVPTGSVDQLAKAITGLLADEDLRAAMGGRGARYATDHLDIRRSIGCIAHAYRAMAQRARASADGDANGAGQRRS